MPTAKNLADNAAAAHKRRNARITPGRTPTIGPLYQTQASADAVCKRPKVKRDGKRTGSQTANKSVDATWMF